MNIILNSSFKNQLIDSHKILKTVSVMFLFISFSFLSVNVVEAATYYVRADGTVTAANKANATSPNAVGTSLNMAQVKLATFSAGDQVLFSSQGGNYTEVFTIPSGGSGVGSEITYANVPSESPVIAITSGYLIDTNSKSNIIIQGLTANYVGGSATTNIGVTIKAGSNIQFKNFSSDMAGLGYNMWSNAILSNVTFDHVTLTNCRAGSLLCLYLFGSSNSNIFVRNVSANVISIGGLSAGTISDLTLSGVITLAGSNISMSNISSAGITLSNATTSVINNATSTGAISVSTGSNISMSNISSAGITLTNVATSTISNASSSGSVSVSTGSNISMSNISSTGITLTNVATSTISNATSTNSVFSISSSNNILLQNIRVIFAQIGISGSYNITINDSEVSNVAGNGVDITTSYNIVFNRVTSNYNTGSGFYISTGAHDISFNRCRANYNGSIGFTPALTSSNITIWYSEGAYNGTINNVFNGGGFLPHDSATNVKCYYCIAYNNYNEGIGDVADGLNNAFYNSLNWNNGSLVGETFLGSTVVTPSARSNIYYRKAGGSMVINNTIFGGGKPREILNTGQAYTTLDYNLYKPLDDNKFYNTANDSSTDISWSAYHLLYEPHSQNADPLFVNGTTGLLSTSTDFQLKALSPAIDSGTSFSGLTSTTTDYIGNPIYGTPDIGAFEYQPPYSITTNNPQYTGNIRIYGDGKYRYTTATSSNLTASLIAVPADTWTYEASTTRPEWLNISNITWGSTKQWTASSTTATTTIYTVGDLTPNSSYTIMLDGSATTTITSSSCSNNICTSSSEGKIIFTYTGGYSTHTFSVSPYVAPSPTPVTTQISYSGSSAQGRISNLISMGFYDQAQQVAKQYNLPLPPNITNLAKTFGAKDVNSSIFTRTLKQGMTGNDVRALQILLNSKGFIVSQKGPGSPGNETTKFGPATKAALVKFQLFYKKEILDSQGIKLPTGILGEGTRKVIIKDQP